METEKSTREHEVPEEYLNCFIQLKQTEAERHRLESGTTGYVKLRIMNFNSRTVLSFYHILERVGLQTNVFLKSKLKSE